MARLVLIVVFTLAAAAAVAPVARADAYRDAAEAIRALHGSIEPGKRAAAAAWLAGSREPQARDAARVALRSALQDPAPQVRRLAAGALARLPEAASRAPIEAALRAERDREVVPALLLALGALRDPTVLPALEAFARDPAPSVRAAAFSAMGDAGGAGARLRLLAALRDPGGSDEAWVVRSAAVMALGKCGNRGDVGDVLAAFRTGDGWSRWLARSALADAVPALDPDPLPLLEHLVHDGDPRVAVTAAVGFTRCGRTDRLLELLVHALPGVRAAAASAVAQAGLRDAAPRLLRLARADTALSVRWAATRALFRLGLPEGDDLVLTALSSPEAAVWAEAVAVLEQRTGERHGRDAAAWRAALERRAKR